VLVRVSENFADALKRKHEAFNQKISMPYYKKPVAFTDFTDLLAKQGEIPEMSLGKNMELNGFKKTKRRIAFELKPIPLP
jgi:hypothetical protein